MIRVSNLTANEVYFVNQMNLNNKMLWRRTFAVQNKSVTREFSSQNLILCAVYS